MGCYTETIFNAISLKIVSLKIVQRDITFTRIFVATSYRGKSSEKIVQCNNSFYPVDTQKNPAMRNNFA